MKIKRPESPLQASTEPIETQDARDLHSAVKGEFADALTQLEAGMTGADAVKGEKSAVSGPQQVVRAALEQIANKADLSNAEQASWAVHESAECMIRSRLAQKYHHSEQGQSLVQNLSDYVAADPLIKQKLLAILKKMKTA